jgi:hypothetical protein
MGLLDDAIREHLELKRRRGADNTEISRQEQEAFGPPRRGEFDTSPAAVQVEDPPHEHVHEPELDSPGEFIADELPPTALHAVEDVPHVQDEPPRPHGDPADHLPHADHAPHIEEAPVQEHRVVEAASPPPGPPAAASQPTREFDPDEVRAASGEPEPEAAAAPRAEEDEPGDEDPDVLEETPEFLQETPEHDRLWFEQRPPRDFDF